VVRRHIPARELAGALSIDLKLARVVGRYAEELQRVQRHCAPPCHERPAAWPFFPHEMRGVGRSENGRLHRCRDRYRDYLGLTIETVSVPSRN